MPKKSDENKTRLSALAQLIQLLSECKGITSSADLVEATGYTDRAIRKAKAEIEFRNSSAAPEIEFRSGNRVPEIEFRNGTRVPPEPRAHAYKESSSKINNSKKDKITPISPKQGTPSQCLEAFQLYNQTAERCGLQQAAKLTKDRQRKISARLKDYGLDGWHQALANIERSSFLTGTNDRTWRATLDFLVQPSSFSKVHDGAYGNGRHAEAAAPVMSPGMLELRRQFEAEGVVFDG